ncbi:MAG: ATP synthase F1 subunit gamma [Candidatus Kerfeldbacteria bacterium]|nr:ATP synthase F1 subunit gamma [Candidatus Kerfeldbacteria bacterium]
MAQAKEIKQRIKSIKNTQKTTKAMELVSGAKMRKAVVGAVSSRTYSMLAWGIVERLMQYVDTTQYAHVRSFFEAREIETGKKTRTTLVMFSSNRGLCGAFNSNLAKMVASYVSTHPQEEVTLICVGKKGAAKLLARGIQPTEVYEKKDSALSDESVRTLAQQLYQHYKAEQTDKVLIAYTDFKSAIAQNPVVKQLYPIVASDSISDLIEDLTPEEQQRRHMKRLSDAPPADYIYEPTGLSILEYLVPRIAEVQLYQALLESNASEHSSRMIAMKNASDAAKEMGQQLLLEFNRARQASITKEIAEITAGSAAVS